MPGHFHKHIFTVQAEEDWLTGLLVIILKKGLSTADPARIGQALNKIFEIPIQEKDIGEPANISWELRSRQDGTRNIPDLVISSPQFSVLLEVKAAACESKDQLLKYAQRLCKEQKKFTGLAFLTGIKESRREKKPEYGRIKFSHVYWHEVIPSLRSLFPQEAESFLIDELEHLLIQLGHIRIKTGDADRDLLIEAQELTREALKGFIKNEKPRITSSQEGNDGILGWGGQYFTFRKYKSTGSQPNLSIDARETDRYCLGLSEKVPKQLLERIRASLHKAGVVTPERAVQIQENARKTYFLLLLKESGYTGMDHQGKIKLLRAFAEPAVRFLRRAAAA